MNTGSTVIPLALASNQEQTEQWVHLMPKGQFQGRDGRGPWVAEDMNSIMEATQRYAGKSLLAVDYEHQIDNSVKNGQPAPAAGWIKGLQAKANGLWGLVEWTAQASAKIKEKEYRYLSPVFNFHPKSGRVIRLLRAGLTNNPALELTALAKAEEGDNMDEELLIQLRQLLGLDETADLTKIVQAVTDLMKTKNDELETAEQSATPDPSQYVPMGDFKNVVAELQQTKRSVAEEDVHLAVNTAINEGRIPPSLEDWGIALCRNDKAAFDQFIEEVSPLFRALRGPQTNGEPQIDSHKGNHLSNTQKAVCDAMGLPHTAYARTVGS